MLESSIVLKICGCTGVVSLSVRLVMYRRKKRRRRMKKMRRRQDTLQQPRNLGATFSWTKQVRTN